jgi:hypothetical protein
MNKICLNALIGNTYKFHERRYKFHERRWVYVHALLIICNHVLYTSLAQSHPE